MNLNLSQIKEMTSGAARIEKDENGICFYRFTKQQEELYKTRSEDFYMKTFATSGVKLSFKTNSQSLFLKADVVPRSSRSYFSFDVFVDGKKIDTLNNFDDMQLPRDYTKTKFNLDEASKNFDLGIGDKKVCVYFPWSVSVVLKEISLDDDCTVEALKPGKKLLCFGDSISQGYDAFYPSSKYITKLADLLDAEEYNKAIGGEIFFPELAAAKESFIPDYITVAYGSNDWNRSTKEAFMHNCRAFFYNLNNSYPNSKIFVITPIWRKDMDEPRQLRFKEVEEFIKNQVEKYNNMTCVRGFEFVPFDEDLFADLRLHPNDNGFAYYYESLAKEIRELI